MTQYAVTWHPAADNIGDDLLTLAASQLLPNVDRVLDADRLDAPLNDLEPDDRVVTLLCGSVLRHPLHWPPERHIAPAFVGVHFSHEDVWGVPFHDLSGTGLKYLTACSPIGCRDERTAALLAELHIPHHLTGCLTLTLPRPHVTPPSEPYMVMCDLPEDVQSALKQHTRGVSFRSVTHTLTAASADYHERMAAAQQLLETYAAAQCVVTRRLHCAMACLAIGTPVLLLYHAAYEDVTRFAPMDSMLRVSSMEDFLHQVRADQFIPHWSNPPGVSRWKDTLRQAVSHSIAQAERMALPILEPEESLAWQQSRLTRMAQSAAHKIHRLENERYEELHEKFTLISHEDAAKSTLVTLLDEPEVRAGLRKAALRRALSSVRWYQRPLLLWKIRRGKVPVEDLYQLAQDTLTPLGWPGHE